MTVSADVLDWGGAGEAGDFAQSFDSGEVFLTSVFDNIIPQLAPHNFDGVIIFNDATDAVDDDGAVETFVVTDGVGAVAEHEDGKVVSLGKFKGFGNFAWLFYLDDVASGTADAHGG